jgi:3-methyladenine DNA glycosylase AlkD
LINIAHAWLLRVAAVSSHDDSTAVSAVAEASAFIRMPRDLFEYQP